MRKGKRLYQGNVSETEFSFRRKKGFLGFDNDSETLVKVVGTVKEENGGGNNHDKDYRTGKRIFNDMDNGWGANCSDFNSR